jgi:hypothetical protein
VHLLLGYSSHVQGVVHGVMNEDDSQKLQNVEEEKQSSK